MVSGIDNPVIISASMGTIIVHRSGYYRKGGIRVRPSTFRVHDRGRPGRGPRTIPTRTPRQSRSRFGTEHPLNKVASRFGVTHMSFLRDKDIDAFTRAGVSAYGEKEFRGMVQARLNQGAKGRFRVVLDKVKSSLDRQYMGNGWQ